MINEVRQPQQQSAAGKEIVNIKEMGVPSIPVAPENGIHCLTIIGQIEGHMVLPPHNKTTKYEHVIPQLVAIEESKGNTRTAADTEHGRRGCGSRTGYSRDDQHYVKAHCVPCAWRRTQHWCAFGC